MDAKQVDTVTVTDPDTHAPVDVTIMKESAGGMFGVDSSFIHQGVGDVFSPFGNGKINVRD